MELIQGSKVQKYTQLTKREKPPTKIKKAKDKRVISAGCSRKLFIKHGFRKKREKKSNK